MKKSIFLFFAAILCAIGASAATKTIYFKSQQWWHKDNAASAAYYWGTGGNANAWPGTRMTKVEGETNMWSIEIDTDKYQNIIFTRVNGSGTVQDWGAKTKDQTIPTNDNNLFTLSATEVWGDPGATGTWSTYTPPTEPVIPDYYIAGNDNFVGADKAWNEKNDALKMTYNETNKNYTFTVTNVAADKECQFKVTDGTWNTTWGGAAVSPAIEGVTKSNDGNVVFTLSTGGDVTVIFDGTNIQLTTTGEIKVAIPDRYITGTPNLVGGTGWGANEVLMTYNEESKLHEHTFTALAAGDYKFKITDGTWDNSWGQDGQDYPFNLPATGDVTIKYNWNDNSIELILPEVTEPDPDPTPDPEPVADVTIYFVNTKSWPSVNAYVWGTGDPYKGWPGEAMTLTGDKAHGYDVYSYTFPAEYTNCIFNGNGQTADLSVKANQYYDIVSEAWYATLADVPYVEPTSLTYTVKVPAGTPECYITGENTGGFGTFVKMNPAAEADVFTVDIAWATESQKYKYSASASWDYEEVNEDGSSVTDRTWQARDEVKKWKTDPTATVTPVDAYTVTVPAGTKECYIRGGFDNWADFHKMTKVDDTHYTISITGATSIHEYKYASGPDWKYAEVKEDGSDAGNRKWDDEEDIVVKWATLYNPETATDYSNQPATIYFRPSTSWKTDNARFEVWFFAGKDGAQDKFVTMTDTDKDGMYEVANDKNYAKVIFVRMNPAGTENDWNSKWNQTGDIEIPNVANNLNTCYAFWTNNIDNTAGTWVVPETIGSGDNTAFYNKYNGKQHINVIVERTFKEDVLHTLCLPFSLPANWIGTAYQLSGVKSNDTEELVLYVKECNTFEAGKPYIVVPTNEELADKEYLLVDDVTISTSLTQNAVSNASYSVTLKGILNGGGQTNGTTEYYIGTDGCLYKNVTNKLALRSVIEVTDKSGAPVYVRARVAFDENVETGVEDIFSTDAPVKLIENGQLIIIRDGVKYNVQGQVIR